MWGAVISGVTSLASSYMDTRKVKTEHKAKVEQARVNAEINRIEKSAQSDQDYDLEALRQTRYSWKDEYVLVIITLPFIGSFIPHIQEHVLKGWEYIAKAPDWYQWCFMGAVAASLGIRWAFKFFGKK
jgi:hypothetical protein